MKSNPFATLAYGAMTLLVAVYIAFVALLMHHDAMPIPVFAGIAFAALAALLLGAKACRTVKLDVAERADQPNRLAFLLADACAVVRGGADGACNSFRHDFVVPPPSLREAFGIIEYT